MDISSLLIGAIFGGFLTYMVTRFLLNESIREEQLAEAIIDSGTGLYTRHYMNEIAPRLIAMHQRDEKAGFAISLIEISKESQTISKYGESIFNRAFATLATLVMETIRETDMAIHFSSNRIAIISDCKNEKAARQTLYRINEKISGLDIPVTNSETIKLETSATQVIHETDQSFSELLNRTERILLGSVSS
ncbi:MAG: diguanylate cyclase [Gammaproteobacteria bacterium]|nr:diguanylate cyclase [Gammaproteobacteria bacterium]NNJ90838.1 diguanylate cyclase [Gammaproteobacteria bacterium]